jgi:acetyl-CoA carboxylase carboxyltransferase component
MASGVIPQITAVFGECGGGLAVLAEMSDFVLMSKDAKLFVTAPNAIAGNNEGKLDTASASYMAASGAVDYVGEDEVAVLNKIRDMVNILPVNNEDECVDECTDDLNRQIAFADDECADPVLALANLSDNGEFVEIKADYAKEMVTGFIKLNGATVGAIGNRTALKDGKNKVKFDAVLTAAGCRKATAFVNYCDAFGIPVLTLSNVTGYSACACDAKEVATEAAKMTFAFAGATVPKINVVTGKSYGTAYAAFNSKSLGADMEFALTGAEIGTMDAKLAAQIVFAGEVNTEEALNEKAAEYSRDYNSAENAAKRGYVDAIIDPSEMRAQIIYAFEMLSTKKELRPNKKHGTV